MKKLLVLIATLFSINVYAQTVVLDAGHGGPGVPGAISVLGEKESHINLEIVLEAGKILAERYPSINVRYTRKTDVDVTLAERSAFTNRIGADIFITVHCNAMRREAANGYAVYIIGTGSDQRERPVYDWKDNQTKKQQITTYDENGNEVQQNYDKSSPESQLFFGQQTETYNTESLRLANIMLDELAKANLPVAAHATRPIPRDVMVLWNTACPSALLECLFLTNQHDAKEIKKPSVKKQFAEVVAETVASYFGLEPGQKVQHSEAKPEAVVAAQQAAQQAATQASKPAQSASQGTSKASKPAAAAPSKNYYGVQIFVINRQLPAQSPEYKGFKVNCEKINGKYYYFACPNTSLSKVKADYPKVKKAFPGSYIIEYSNGFVRRP